MDAQELRIGNIIYSPAKGGSGYTYVTHRIINDLASHTQPLNYAPIPLTEDWLLKFGFEKKTDENYMSGDMYNWIFRLHNVDEEDIWLSKTFVLKCNQIRIYTPQVRIKYVHQLQNLFFVLAGKELKLKEKVNDISGNT